MTWFYTREDTLAAVYFQHALRLAEQQSLNPAQLVRDAELETNPLTEGSSLASLPARAYERLCRLIRHELAAHSFCDQRLVDSFEVLCHCLESSQTLGEAIRRSEQLINLTQPEARPMHNRREGNSFHFAWNSVISSWEGSRWQPRGPLQMEAYVLFFWHRLFSWLVDTLIPLHAVTVSHPRPPNHAEIDALFAAPLNYQAEANSLCFDTQWLERPVIRSPSDFRELLHRSEYNFFLISDSQIIPTSQQVKRVLEQNSGAPPNLEQVATQLHLSASSLRRYLKREQTQFQTLKDQVQQHRAQALLAQSGLSINQIAQQLGFTDASVFQRAFKRWTGWTPGEWRREQTALLATY